MKKLIFLPFMLLLCINSATARSENDSIFQVLKYVLNHKDQYILEKEGQIEEVKNRLKIPELTDNQYYTINKQIYAEYQFYQTDSALYYLRKNLLLAEKMHNEEYIYETKLNLSFLYWQIGKFFESMRNIDSLDRNRLDQLPKALLLRYLESYKQLYRYYAQSQVDKDNGYYHLSNAYRDSLLKVVEMDSKSYKVLTAEKLTDENRTQEAARIMMGLLEQSTVEDHEQAIFANILANIYREENNIAMQKKYYTISAICDVRNAIKENTSMQALALILYREGDIDNAYLFIQSSIDDAVFCNARFRTYELTKIFPIIDSAYQAKATKQKQELKLYLLLVSILSGFLVLAVIYVYRQIQRISKIRKELYRTNLKQQDLNNDLQDSNNRLHQLNSELTDVNRKLSETNLVKEIYLGKFIDLCSNYIEKLDNYRRSLNRIAGTGKVDELYTALKSTKYIDSELSDFYTNFDETFLRIYPTFIQDFNTFFTEDEQPTVKPGELLNTELRIYALIRLGINDSSKIAVFLRYSITTVYTYRSKLKNKSFFKESLEEEVMKIGT